MAGKNAAAATPRKPTKGPSVPVGRSRAPIANAVDAEAEATVADESDGEFPKMLYDKKGRDRRVLNAEDEQYWVGKGFSLDAPPEDLPAPHELIK